MNYRSTRGGEPVGLEEVLHRGLAPDGGLYVPEQLPRLDAGEFDDEEMVPEVAERLLTPFFAHSSLADALGSICRQALNFPIPVTEISDGAWMLELFHGPTCAFKDVGARFLAACLGRISSPAPPTVVLTATSGDTGAAVASALEPVPGVNAAVLFPTAGVSARQRHQLTCWGGDTASFAVDADFDRCQALVKSAFGDAALGRQLSLTSANSISIGRLLPQMSYYAASSLEVYGATGEKPGYIVPTGNLGNALACVWARHMGLPIGDIVLATNANRTIPRFLKTGRWSPRGTVSTLASAMDVASPSNMERLRDLFPTPDELEREVSAESVTDEQIRAAIRHAFEQHTRIICPHTATAWHLWRDLRGTGGPWVVVATAHPAKFENIVEPLVGAPVPLPPALEELLARPTREESLEPSLDALCEALLSRFG